MLLVVVHPGDCALFYVKCPHCHEGFGKGDKPELAFEAVDRKTAIHKTCVDELTAMAEPEEVQKRFSTARDALLADREALAVKSKRARLRRAG
jgi:hypothetical protein